MNNANALNREINLLRKMQQAVLTERQPLHSLLSDDIIDLSTYEQTLTRFNAHYDSLSNEIAYLSKQLFDLTKPQNEHH